MGLRALPSHNCRRSGSPGRSMSSLDWPDGLSGRLHATRLCRQSVVIALFDHACRAARKNACTNEMVETARSGPEEPIVGTPVLCRDSHPGGQQERLALVLTGRGNSVPQATYSRSCVVGNLQVHRGFRENACARRPRYCVGVRMTRFGCGFRRGTGHSDSHLDRPGFHRPDSGTANNAVHGRMSNVCRGHIHDTSSPG